VAKDSSHKLQYKHNFTQNTENCLWLLLVTWFGDRFYLIGFFIYISNVISFLSFLSLNSLCPPSPPTFMRMFPPKPALTFELTYTGGRGFCFARTKGFSFHWCPTRPSSATYAAGAMGLPMCTLEMVVLSLGALVGWYCCSHGVTSPSTPSILFLTPPMETPFSAQWFAASICLCIWHVLAEPLRRQLYQASKNMHFLPSTILSRFGGCMYMSWIPRWKQALKGHSFCLCSKVCLHISSYEYFCSPF